MVVNKSASVFVFLKMCLGFSFVEAIFHLQAGTPNIFYMESPKLDNLFHNFAGNITVKNIIDTYF